MTDNKKLDDFGEHIAGAKKETFKAVDLANENTKKLPLSKLWSDKDIKDIEDIHIRAVAFALKESLPNKPRNHYKLSYWLDTLHKHQNTIVDLLQKDDLSYTNQHIDKISNSSAKNKAYLLPNIAFEDWKHIGKVAFYQSAGSNGVRLGVQIDNKEYSFSPKEHSTLANFDYKKIIDEFAEEIKQQVEQNKQDKSQNNTKTKELTASSFDIYTRRKDNTTFICAKTDRQKTPLIEFATLAEAREYLKDPENIVELGRRWTAHREQNSITKADMRNAVNEDEERTGQSYRDHDITPDEFMATFGVRGGQFGNWVTGDERQQMLNNAYDGFMDLSKAININPKAIGLNGTLGIAFGARGSGWASAHYERGEQVINLTKTRGAGSLAHEWWHALDHYMKNGDDLLTRHLNTNSTARHQELIAPVRELLKGIHKSGLYSRSQIADAYRNPAYFATDVEMTARAFESYIQYELSTNGIKNDFLANIRSEKEWQKNLDAYPYPKAEELEELGKAYNAVFDTLKEVDKEFTPTHYEPEQIIHADTLAVNDVDKTKEPFVLDTYLQNNGFTQDNNGIWQKEISGYHDKLMVYGYPNSSLDISLGNNHSTLIAKMDKNISIEEIHQTFTESWYSDLVEWQLDKDNEKTQDNLEQEHAKQPLNITDEPQAQTASKSTQQPQQLRSVANKILINNYLENNGFKKGINVGSYRKQIDDNNLLVVGIANDVSITSIADSKVQEQETVLSLAQDLSEDDIKQAFSQSKLWQQATYTPTISQYDTKLNTPYAEKNQAKALGAKWDNTNKTWYAPAGLDLNKFKKWLPQERSNKKTYLYVSYAEKDEAKKLGARWDKEAESWYVPSDKNVSDFSRWTSPPVVESLETQFTKVLQAAGCVVPSGHPIMDGRFHRIPVEGDKSGAKSGSYIAHLDGIPRGTVQNFKTGSQTKWVANVAQDYKTPNTAEITAARLKAEQEQKARYDKVANDVKQLLSVAPIAQSHPYLKKKEVQAHGLYIVPDASQLPQDSSFRIANDWREAKTMRNHFAETRQEYTVLTRGDLIVPAYQNGEIRTMQTINEGFKGFVKGGEKSGSYLVLGEPKQNEPILIAEGYATAATLHEALGRPVVIAFDAGNLSKVANTVRENLPNSQIYIMADNDIKNEKNTGIVKAKEAAKQVDGLVIAPQFESPEHGSDWNDLATNKGVDELKSQIRSQLIAYQLQKEGTLNITKKNFQDPEMNAVQEQVMGKALANPQSLIDRYAADPRTFEGRYIASDMMKEVFEVYSESPQARNQYNNAVHNTAAALAAEHFNQVLESPKDGERNKVVFLTGSPGAGKTSSILNNGNFPDDAKLVFEGQLANAHQNPATLDKLQKALDLGYEVEIRVAHPKPEIALENTFRRYYDVNDGRGAPIDTMARIQGNTPEALKFIYDKFGDKVSIVINDTTQGYENIQQLRGWEHLNVLQSQGNEQQIKQRLETSLVQYYAEGRIDYECFKQSAGSEERAKQLQQELFNNRRLVQSVNVEFRANEQGRELSQESSSTSNKLDKGHFTTASNRARQEGRTESQLQPSAQRVYQDTRESLIEQAKTTLSNKDYINVEGWLRNVDYKYSNAINEGLQKLQSLQSKLPDIASGKFNLPPAPPIVQQQTIQIQPSQGQNLENDTDKKLN